MPSRACQRAWDSVGKPGSHAWHIDIICLFSTMTTHFRNQRRPHEWFCPCWEPTKGKTTRRCQWRNLRTLMNQIVFRALAFFGCPSIYLNPLIALLVTKMHSGTRHWQWLHPLCQAMKKTTPVVHGFLLIRFIWRKSQVMTRAMPSLPEWAESPTVPMIGCQNERCCKSKRCIYSSILESQYSIICNIPCQQPHPKYTHRLDDTDLAKPFCLLLRQATQYHVNQAECLQKSPVLQQPAGKCIEATCKAVYRNQRAGLQT